MFFPMSCKVFKMGKGTANRDVVGLIMKYEGHVSATQDDKYFEETSLTKEVVTGDDLKKLVINETLGNDIGFQLAWQKPLLGLKL